MLSFTEQCRWCGEPFTAHRRTARYCSDAHGAAYRRRATDEWKAEAQSLLMDQTRAIIAQDAEALDAVIARFDRLVSTDTPWRRLAA